MTVTEKSGTEANFGRCLSNSKCVFMVFHPFVVCFGESVPLLL